MDVLIPDQQTPTALRAADVLRGAGHRVHRCIGPGGVLCEAMAGHDCPLDAPGVDVVVDVRDGDEPSPFAAGGLCAARRHLPLVLFGGRPEHPLTPWATAVADGDLAAAVTSATMVPMPVQTATAAKALLRELRQHGTPSHAASVAVFRREGRLLVELQADESISRTQGERLAAHLAQAVRGVDRWAPKLDVTVHISPRAAAIA